MRAVNKKGFEFSFGWIFALIFGGIIIFLAIYMAFNIVSGERRASDSGLAKSFDTLLYPIGTGLESNKVTQITFPVETRISFQCSSNTGFGEQIIRTSSSSLGSKYSENPISVKSKDKYIFSSSSVEGKTFLTFVKPLDLPFEVADMIYFIPTTEKYCFVISKSSTVGKEIDGLKNNNHLFNKTIFIEDSNNCPQDSKKICFNMGNTRDCHASISGDRISKGNTSVYFDGGENGNALLYAAIFSEPEYYECQLKRLNKRASELAKLYLQKQQMSPAGCGQGVETELETYANLTESFNSSGSSLSNILYISKNLEGRNDRLSCPLF